MKYVEIILKGIGTSEREIELGKIAAYLHDTGAIEGKNGHAARSAEFAKNYLKNIDIKEEEKAMIVHAISDHSNGNNLESNIGAALVIADKIDMFEDRMLRFLDNNYFHDNIKHMKDIELTVDNENIYVNIVTDGCFDYLSLKDYSKMITKPHEMAKYLNRKCVFSIDGKTVDLLDMINITKSLSKTL
jgi:HD superfamily phosphodiesterase